MPSAAIDLLERTAHPDPITSRLLISAADVLEGNEALDTLFRQQLTGLLARGWLAGACRRARCLIRPALGGPGAKVLLRATERLRSDNGADVSLAALASGCRPVALPLLRALQGKHRAFSPHAWLRQYRLEQAMKMLRDSSTSIVSVSAELGYASQTAFAAAFEIDR